MSETKHSGAAARTAALVLAAVALLLGAGQAQAQGPDKFVNLKVLPKDITKPELMGIMREFSSALGVHCTTCHVEVKEQGKESHMDFPADDKDEKKTARLMLQMVQDINQKWISQVQHDHADEGAEHGKTDEHAGKTDEHAGKTDEHAGKTDEHAGKTDEHAHQGHDHPEGLRVHCVTCHHGLQHPQTIQDVLHPLLAKNDVPGAIQQYRDLRKQYYGGFQYDFSDRSLNSLAMELLRAKKPADALALLQVNLELNPSSVMAVFQTGEAYLAQGDKAKAIENYKKALQMDSTFEPAQEKLDDLQKGD